VEIVKERLSKYIQIFRNKKGLNKPGHKTFSIAIFLIFIYFLKKEEILSIELFWILIFHLPFYIIGASCILDYGIFESYKSGRNHRGPLHSISMLWLLILLFIPITISLYLNSDKYNLLGIPFNQYSILCSVCIGLATHLFGDSLTSQLRR